ncbi:hypothetical protein PLICRDRAFT_56139 [Plicaturopsis crispa FD-325 SS-3]|nr:hypothetical protein PLICRDRAFT_56139 [Plicaturopsis crispa FD-325 SS-3]
MAVTTQNDIRHFALQRPVFAKDWDRCSAYAGRVHVLQQAHEDIYMDADSSYALMISAPPSPFLPNLEILELWTGSAIETPLFPARILLGPRISTMQVMHTNEGSLLHDTSLFSSLPAACTGMRHFTLSSSRLAPEIVAGTVARWPNLESLHLDHLDCRSLLHLSTLDSLRKLSFGWSDMASVAQAYLATAPQQKRFLGLQSLVVKALGDHADLSMMDTLLGLTTWSILKHIDFSVASRGSRVSWNQLFRRVAEQCSVTSMCSVWVAAPADPTLRNISRDADECISLPTLQPLLSFHHLVSFICEYLDGFDLDDVGLRVIATSWPKLETLDLAQCDGWTIPSKITLNGLIELLQLCPNLTGLGIVVDATVGIDLQHTPVYANRQITTIFLGNSAVSNDCASIAAVLSDVLPCLESIVSWTMLEKLFGSHSAHEVARYRESWKEVEKLVSSFAAVRQQERARAVLAQQPQDASLESLQSQT